MTQQRQYESAMVFGARIVIMNHLWTPSDVYKGKKQEKPSWFAGFIVPKTQAQWHAEPMLAGIAQACGKIWDVNKAIVTWPIADGDLPNPENGKHSEWAKGHWLFNASTNTNPPNVELTQANGTLVKLTSRMGVKSGDYVMVGVTAAVKQNDARAVKLFLNAVVFSQPGEEIAIGNSVSGAEMMAKAAEQGLRPAGFGASGGGFAGPGPGFTPGSGGGFAPPHGGAAFGGSASGPAPGSASPSNPFGGGQSASPFGGQHSTTISPSRPFS